MVLKDRRRLLLAIAVSASACLVTATLFDHRTPLPDEIRPLLLTQAALAEQMELIRADIVQTPVFNLAARLWFAGVGPSDAAAKSMVALLNVAALTCFAFLAFRLSRRWWLALALATLFYLRVGSSITIIRMYGVTILFVIVAMLMWDRWVRTKDARPMIGCMVCMVAAIYSHASASLLLPAFLIASWPVAEKRWHALALAGLPALAFAPWVLYVLPEIASRGLSANVEAIVGDPWRIAARLPFEFLSGEDPGGASPPLILENWAARYPLRWAALIGHVALIAAFLANARKARVSILADPWPRFVLAALVLPPLILLSLSYIFMPVIHTRYVLVSLPAYWLALTWLGDETSRVGRVVFAGLFIWIAASVALTWRVHWAPSEVHRATNHIAEGWTDDDLLINANQYPLGWQTYWDWEWRLKHPGRMVTLEPHPTTLPWLRDILPHEPLRRSLLDDVERAWVIFMTADREAVIRDSLTAMGFASVDPGFDWSRLLRFDRSGSGAQNATASHAEP